MILTVLLMFSGPGVIAVFCIAKAYCGAKEVSKSPKKCCSAIYMLYNAGINYDSTKN